MGSKRVHRGLDVPRICEDLIFDGWCLLNHTVQRVYARCVTLLKCLLLLCLSMQAGKITRLGMHLKRAR